MPLTAVLLGDSTAGSWSEYLDGSDVGLSESSDEDIYGVSVAINNGEILLTTRGNFVTSGDEADIFSCLSIT